jgi:hypothetical protein
MVYCLSPLVPPLLSPEILGRGRVGTLPPLLLKFPETPANGRNLASTGHPKKGARNLYHSILLGGVLGLYNAAFRFRFFISIADFILDCLFGRYCPSGMIIFEPGPKDICLFCQGWAH